MKIGLLICDHLKPELSKTFGDYPQLYSKLFPKYSFVLHDITKGQFPENLNQYDAFMATGSHHAVYNNIPWITQLKKLVRTIYEEKIPYVGFCFGHQLIGESLGGKVVKSSAGWCTGIHKFDILESPNWISNSVKQFNMLMMCEDQILQLPERAKVIATNQDCPNGVVQLDEHFLGLQGHPEFPKELNRALLERRKGKLTPEAYDNAIQSYNSDIDVELFQKWIHSFLQNALELKQRAY